MIVNNTFGVMKFNNNSFALFYYNASAENATSRVIFKNSSLKNVTTLKFYQFDKPRGKLYVGDTVSNNITQYNFNSTYDVNGTLIDINWGP